MKQMIKDVVTFAVVISFTCNTFATSAKAQDSSSQKTKRPQANQPQRIFTPDGKSVTVVPVNKSHAAEPATWTDKVLNFFGINAGPEVKTGPSLSDVVKQHQQKADQPTNIESPQNIQRLQEAQVLGQLPVANDKNYVNADQSIPVIEIDSNSMAKVNLSDIDPKNPRQLRSEIERVSGKVPITEYDVAKLLAITQQQMNAKNGFYFPSAEDKFQIRLTEEQQAQFKKEFPGLHFENAGKKGNILNLKIKNPNSKKDVFIGYKIDPALVKKFSPLMIEESLGKQFKDAGSHAAAAFPVEALSFYIGIYVNTLINLLAEYEKDPAAMDKFWHEAKSIPGQISFFAFMIGNRMFTTSLTPLVETIGNKQSRALLKQILPFFGMGVGSIASAGMHDVITMTQKCAVDLMKADEFNDQEKNEAMAGCQGAYNQVVSSENLHNYITSFMNMLVVGAGSFAASGILSLAGSPGYIPISQNIALPGGTRMALNTLSGTANVAGKNFVGRGLSRTSVVLESIVFELKSAREETRAYALAKTMMNGGKMTMAARAAKWFGYIPGKAGNLTRVGLSLGSIGWKVAGAIVIFLQMDERVRPYTYKFEQEIMGSGSELSQLIRRSKVQLDYLKANNWSMDICTAHVTQNQKNGFQSFYTINSKDCNFLEKTDAVKKESKLWREAILYKFMGAYTNWLMYVEHFHSEWNMAYVFGEQFVEAAHAAKLAQYDPKQSSRFNPLLHDDIFWGVRNSDRVTDATVAPYLELDNSLTFAGLNKVRAQRVIDLLPLIGKIRLEVTKKSDWKDIDQLLTKMAENISNYLIQSARAKGSKADLQTIVKEHFSKKELSPEDLPALEDYNLLVTNINLLNQAFEGYAEGYKASKKAVPSRDRTAQENQRLASLYDKVIFLKTVRSYLGNPKPAVRGEAFIRSFDEYAKSSHTPEQLKAVAGDFGSPGTALLRHALCSEKFIKDPNVNIVSVIKNGMIKSQTVNVRETNVTSSSFGENVDFVYPRLVDKLDMKLCTILGRQVPYAKPTKYEKVTGVDHLMKRLSSTLLDSSGSRFPSVWDSTVLPQLKVAYEKFDQSYQILLRKQFVPRFMGDNLENIFAVGAKNPLEAYKMVLNQPRSKFGSSGNSVVQTFADEAETYLRIVSDSFDASMKRELDKKNASGVSANQKRMFAELMKQRKARFDTLVRHFRVTFTNILLSFGNNNADIEKQYASLLVTYFQLMKSVGIFGDIEIKQENVEVGGEVTTKVVSTISRSQMGEMFLSQYYKEKLTEKNKGVELGNSAYSLIQQLADQAYGAKMRLRIENQPEIRNAFEGMRENLARSDSAQNAYLSDDRNMSLPDLQIDPEAGSVSVSPVRMSLAYPETSHMAAQQYLALAGVSKNLDELMEELYFNVNILKAANIDNKYRNVEKESLNKYKATTMGGG